jgi:tRNA-specific 2-thiouridylase
VLSGLDQRALAALILPIGDRTKADVRALASQRGLAVATKPDSQDVCFIASRTPGLGRESFLSERIALHPATVEDEAGRTVGEVAAVELVTLGQRRGLGAADGGDRQYAIEVDVARRRVVVGPPERLLTAKVRLTDRTWTSLPLPPGTPVEVQTSAHGAPVEAHLTAEGITYRSPGRRVAVGQIVACYQGDVVVGSGVAA